LKEETGTALRWKLALLGLSLLAALGAAELLSRWLVWDRVTKTEPPLLRLSDDPLLGWEPVPNTREYNNWGFRGEDIALQKPAGVRRVAFIGDSVTHGMGVHAHETFAHRIGQQLERERPRRYQVLNCGVPGAGTFQTYRWLETRVLSFDPDLVVLTLTMDDVEPSPVVIRAGDAQIIFLNQAAEHWLLNNRAHWALVSRSALYRLLHRVVVLALYGRDDEASHQQTARAAPKVARQNVLRMARLCRERGTRLAVVLSPVLLPYRGTPASLAEHRRAFRLLASLGQDVDALVDLGPLYAAHAGRLKLIEDDNEHPNSVGHRLIAEYLLGELWRRGLLGKGR